MPPDHLRFDSPRLLSWQPHYILVGGQMHAALLQESYHGGVCDWYYDSRLWQHSTLHNEAKKWPMRLGCHVDERFGGIGGQHDCYNRTWDDILHWTSSGTDADLHCVVPCRCHYHILEGLPLCSHLDCPCGHRRRIHGNILAPDR